MVDQSSFSASSAWLNNSLSPMASTASDNSTGPLGSLAAERRLLPDHQSSRTKAMTFCKRIDHVEIRGSEKINGYTQYAVEIFYKKPQSNIPTTQKLLLENPTLLLADDTPDVVKHRRFSLFANLRHEMYFHASIGHGKQACAFCSAMTSLLNDGPTLPRLSLKLFHGEASICQALEGFLNSSLELVNSLPSITTRRLCDGQQEIPLLLERFLSEAVQSYPEPHDKNRSSRKLSSRSLRA